MNIRDPEIKAQTVLDALAESGMIGRAELDDLYGDLEDPRTADIYRLIEGQLVDADKLAAFFSAFYGLPLSERDELSSIEPTVQNLSHRFLIDNWLLPHKDPQGRLRFGVLFPGDHEPIEALQAAFGEPAELWVMSAPDLESGLLRLTGSEAGSAAASEIAASDDSIADLRDLASGAPVVVAVDDIFRRALDLRATDIHLEPMRGRLILRFRIDGVLRIMPSPPQEMAEALVSRIKVLAGLDIAERRKPQDGGMRIRVGERDIEFRVATLASIHGETVALRILQRESALLDLTSVGLGQRDRHALERLLDHTHGMIAVAGPTGSGKTTTLAAALSKLNDPGRKIVTIEDPVEYQIPGIVQAQIQPAIGVTFEAAIRSFVRQDPDVILVGEIRDRDTARVAIQAALTGHLVLTTVHANTATAAFTRLRDLGVEVFLLVGAVRGVISQRLVRRLCDHCKRPATITAEEVAAEPRFGTVGFRAGDGVHHAVGCSRCAGAGYRGRIAVFEVLTMSDELSRLASAGADNLEIESAAIAAGMTTMSQDAADKARAGLTSPAEVIRVTGFR